MSSSSDFGNIDASPPEEKEFQAITKIVKTILK